MSFLRTHFLALALVSVAVPAVAAGADDLDPKVLVADTGSCGKAAMGNGSSGVIEFQALGGSMALEGAKNLCFGSNSISQVSVSAPGVAPVVSGSSTTSSVIAAGGGGGGGGGGSTTSQTVAANVVSSGGGGNDVTGALGATTSPTGGSTSSPSSFFGGGGGSSGGSNVGVPGPEAGAGLPFLIVAGAYALVRRRRTRARA